MYRILSLYSGPHVTIRIGSASHEYKLPKALLCEQSPYFKAMFEGSFIEGKEQSTTLEEVTPRSFQMLLQWVCLGRVVFSESTPDDDITAAIEFARLADMCEITGMESLVAEHIKAIILANPGPDDLSWPSPRGLDTNTDCLTSQQITLAVALPEWHPVRAILAAATVEGCLTQQSYRFEREASTVPGFAVDLLKAVRVTLYSIHTEHGVFYVEDPIRKEKIGLKTEEK